MFLLLTVQWFSSPQATGHLKVTHINLGSSIDEQTKINKFEEKKLLCLLKCEVVWERTIALMTCSWSEMEIVQIKLLRSIYAMECFVRIFITSIYSHYFGRFRCLLQLNGSQFYRTVTCFDVQPVLCTVHVMPTERIVRYVISPEHDRSFTVLFA